MIWDGCTASKPGCSSNQDGGRHECGGDTSHRGKHKCSWCGKEW